MAATEKHLQFQIKVKIININKKERIKFQSQKVIVGGDTFSNIKINYRYDNLDDIRLIIHVGYPHSPHKTSEEIFDSKCESFFEDDVIESNFIELNHKIRLDERYFICLNGFSIDNTIYNEKSLEGCLNGLRFIVENEGKKKRVDGFPDQCGEIYDSELSPSQLQILNEGKVVYMIYEDLGYTHFVRVTKRKNKFRMSCYLGNLDITLNEETLLKEFCTLMSGRETELRCEIFPGGNSRWCLDDVNFVMKYGKSYYCSLRGKCYRDPHFGGGYYSDERNMGVSYIDEKNISNTIKYLSNV